MIFALIAILVSTSANAASAPGFEALKATGNSERLCTADGRICIDSPKPGVLSITRDDRKIGSWSVDTEGGDLSIKPMPALIRLDDGRLLIGALATRQTGYSGSGGNATQQVLALVAPDKEVKPVLTVPESGSLMIRACFGEKDMKRRANACHDEYRFTGTLTAADRVNVQLPLLRFRMNASHYPRGVSRNNDSLTLPPLRKRDLTWQVDKRCTFERSFHFDPAQGTYVPDAVLPDCSDYTEP
jgi:hypothetical protein